MSPVARPAPDPATDSLLEAFWRKIPDVVTTARHGYPRVHANVRVRIAGVEGEPVVLRSNDLSLGGLQIGCDRATGQKLAAGADAPGEERPTYRVSLLLEVESGRLQVNGRARVMHVSVLPAAPTDADTAVGLQFVDFDDGGREAIMRFIEFHMRPAGT